MLTALLVFLPLLVSVVVFLSPRKLAPGIALAGSLAALAIAALMINAFDPAIGRQFSFEQAWLPEFGISLKMGVDGFSLLMVILTTVLTPLILASTFNQARSSGFFGLILFMESALLGVFVAQDAFLYYLFWEMALIPVYFLVLIWGNDNNKVVTYKFFVYTLAGSLFMLAGILLLYFNNPARTFDIDQLYTLQLSGNQQSLIFILMFVAFAIKLPLFPFHTWQASTYTVAPTAATMLLSGIMLKMAVYSIVRWIFPIVPLGAWVWGDVVLGMSIIGVLYGGWIAVRQDNIKTMLAYSSFSHVGLIVAGLFCFTEEGIQGAMFQSFAHGINVVGLFFIAEILFQRLQTHDLKLMGGLRVSAPVLASFFLILMFGSIGLPMTNGFIGEFMLLRALAGYKLWLGVLAGATVIIGAVYMLRAFQKSMLGGSEKETFTLSDLTLREKIILFPLAAVVIVTGIYPQLILQITGPASAKLGELFNVYLNYSSLN